MKRRASSVLIGLILFACALGLGEVFPGLKPYLPSMEALIGDLTGKATYQVDERNPKQNVKQVVLALSWAPAFCETAPGKRECKSQRKGRFDTENLTLHGLWPEEQYCHKTPYKNLSDSLWQNLKIAMPGTASGLHKHEWKKHGTCYTNMPERYFRDSLRLVAAFNQTPVRSLFKGNIGQFLSAEEIRQAFDNAFGKGAGSKVLLHCVRDGQRTLLQELRIALKGDIEKANLKKLLRASPHQKRGCKGGIIDDVGLS